MIYESTTLYAKAWNNAIMQWKLKVDYTDTGIIIMKFHGFYNSTTSTYYEKKHGAFSINDINKIALKIVSDKRNKGYRSLQDLNYDSEDLFKFLDDNLTTDKFDKEDIFKPMKANKFKPGIMEYPAYAQPKINGVRCVVRMNKVSQGLFGETLEISVRSRDGIEYDVPHIKATFKTIYTGLNLTNDTVFDGELWANAPAPTIAGAAKNVNNPYNAKLRYIIFDLAIPNIDQSERFEILNKIGSHSLLSYVDKVEMLKTYITNSDEESIVYGNQFIDEGYEGAIIRDTSAPYYFGGRRNNMLKIKKYIVEKFLVLDITLDNEGLKEGREQVLFYCKNNRSADTFHCVPTGTKEKQLEMYRNKTRYTGTMVDIKFYERTKNNLPFHANVINLK